MLERDAELSVLADAVRAATGGDGSVVLVMGEAGIGKSSLVEALRAHLPAEGRLLVGYCDDLATPRTLRPFRDLVGSVGTELGRAVTDGGDRDRVFAALCAELTWPEHPTVLVIEDIHWADDATIDALRYLVRRIADLPAVLILTYREDELSREHPIHGLLGQASRTVQVRHLPLRRLSPAAVRQLCAGSPVDADAIVRYGPAAARDAARAGAHREALAHFGLVLGHAERFTAAERADLLERYAIECYTIGTAEKGIIAQRQAVELNRSLGDPRVLGSSLRWLSRMHWWAGDRGAAERAGRDAVDVLERAGDTRLLALALSNRSQLYMLAHRAPESISHGERAVALAREAGDPAIISHALTNIGASQWFLGDPAGRDTMEEALRVALDAGEVEGGRPPPVPPSSVSSTPRISSRSR